MTDLKILAEQWQSINDENERNKFYEEMVFPAVIEDVVTKEQKNHPNPYTHLILPVGLSPEPLILSILILRPERVYFLYSKMSEKYLERIVSATRLQINQVDKDEIDDTSVPDIYQKVKITYERWGKPERIAVDITGGKKSMVGGCALAGSLIGARLFYVDSKYNGKLKKPEPGSEQLMILENPYDVFGDLKLERARDLFAQLDFVGAKSLLEELEVETSTPNFYTARRLLCEAYSAWDDWKIDEALEKMRLVIRTVVLYARSDSNASLAQHLPYLKKQVSILEQLKVAIGSQLDLDLLGKPELYLPMMATLRSGAIRQEKRGKLDVAALIWYRLIELLSQQRLSFFGLKTSEPDYRDVIKDNPELLEKYNIEAGNCSSKNSGVLALPNPISLLQGYILLKALKDPFLNSQKLNKIDGKVSARNKGIFAHGFIPLNEKDYKAFRDLAEELLEAFKIVAPCDNFCWDDCQFVKNL